MILKDALENIEIESINDKKNNLDDVQHEEILNKRNFQKDEEMMKLESNLRSRAQDLHHDWLADKYLHDVNMFKKHLNHCKCTMKFKKIFQTFEEIENLSILNIEQRVLFDKVLNHFMFSIKKQLLFQVDDETETRKSLCIDLIFFHMNYHAHQRKESSFVLRAAFIDVVAHNISDNILH